MRSGAVPVEGHQRRSAPSLPQACLRHADEPQGREVTRGSERLSTRIRVEFCSFILAGGIFFAVQTATPPMDELADRIVATTGLPPGVARRLIQDVLAHHAETVEDFVARRHRELAAEGWKNAAIYDRLRVEVAGRLFKGPECTTRQIRRMVYG